MGQHKTWLAQAQAGPPQQPAPRVRVCTASEHTLAREPDQPGGRAQVTTLVAFNRCQYAQLSQQRCEAPRGYPALPPQASPQHQPALLGLLLALGFELVAGRSGTAPPSRRPPESRTERQPGAGAATAEPGKAGDQQQPGPGAAGAGPAQARAQEQPPEAGPAAQQQDRAAGTDAAPGGRAAAGARRAQLAGSRWEAFLASLQRCGYFGGNIMGAALVPGPGEQEPAAVQPLCRSHMRLRQQLCPALSSLMTCSLPLRCRLQGLQAPAGLSRGVLPAAS